MIRTLALFSAALMLVATPEVTYAKGSNHCPPGLAKKDPPCVPPGLAKRDTGITVDDGLGDYDGLRAGDRVRIDGIEYRVIRAGDRVVLQRADGGLYRLPDDGSTYGRIRDALVKVDEKAQTAIRIIELTDLLLN